MQAHGRNTQAQEIITVATKNITSPSVTDFESWLAAAETGASAGVYRQGTADADALDMLQDFAQSDQSVRNLTGADVASWTFTRRGKDATGPKSMHEVYQTVARIYSTLPQDVRDLIYVQTMPRGGEDITLVHLGNAPVAALESIAAVVATRKRNLQTAKRALQRAESAKTPVPSIISAKRDAVDSAQTRYDSVVQDARQIHARVVEAAE